MLRILSVTVCAGVLGAVSTSAPGGGSETISLPLKNILANGQQSFVGDISVGTPAQPMAVVVDISSRLSYVPSVDCSDPFCKGHRQYDSSASSTYQEDGTPFELPGGQNASGVLSKDDIGVAGLTVQGQTFGEATAVWNKWTLQAPNDGTLGLGFTPQPDRLPSILDTMTEQDLIARRVAGLWLGRNPAGGELTLGGLNADRYSGQLAWVSTLLNPNGWMVLAESVTVGDVSLCADGGCMVSASSVTPYFYMSMATAKAVNDALGGIDVGQPGVAALDCTTLNKLPFFNLEIAGYNMTMDPLEYTFVIPRGRGTETCLSGFVGLSELSDNSLFVGTLFMQQFYMAYDVENQRVGFATSA